MHDQPQKFPFTLRGGKGDGGLRRDVPPAAAFFMLAPVHFWKRLVAGAAQSAISLCSAQRRSPSGPHQVNGLRTLAPARVGVRG